MNCVRIPAYAKVNLCLYILGQRPDGYHELRTIFQTITLHDTLTLETTRDSQTSLRIDGNDELAEKPSRDNLVYRAIEVLREAIGMRAGVRAVLTKRIPVGAGLGGGSSDAAAVLIGVLRLSGKRIEAPRLAEIAAGLGADVPFFLHGGRALGIGRGDEIYPLPDVARRTVAVVSPRGIAVPTVDAYKWVSQGQPATAKKHASQKLTNQAHASRIMRFCALCWSPQVAALSNDFESAVFPRYRRLAAIKRELLRQGAADASLAGSGSAVFAIYQHPATARRIAQAFPRDRVFVCSTISRAEYRRKLGAPHLV